MQELSLDSNYLFHVDDKNLKDEPYTGVIEAQKNTSFIASRIQKQREYYDETLNKMGIFVKQYVGGLL